MKLNKLSLSLVLIAALSFVLLVPGATIAQEDTNGVQQQPDAQPGTEPGAQPGVTDPGLTDPGLLPGTQFSLQCELSDTTGIAPQGQDLGAQDLQPGQTLTFQCTVVQRTAQPGAADSTLQTQDQPQMEPVQPQQQQQLDGDQPQEDPGVAEQPGVLPQTGDAQPQQDEGLQPGQEQQDPGVAEQPGVLPQTGGVQPQQDEGLQPGQEQQDPGVAEQPGVLPQTGGVQPQQDEGLQPGQEQQDPGVAEQPGVLPQTGGVQPQQDEGLQPGQEQQDPGVAEQPGVLPQTGGVQPQQDQALQPGQETGDQTEAFECRIVEGPDGVIQEGSTLSIECTVLEGTPGLAAPSGAMVAPDGAQVHTVQAGETLSAIAAQYGVSVDELAQFNNIADPNRIQIGQQISIPAAEAMQPQDQQQMTDQDQQMMDQDQEQMMDQDQEQILDQDQEQMLDQEQAPAAAEQTVDISDFAFNPANLEIEVGTTVTWTNNDSAPHTVTDTSDDPAFDSGRLSQGDTFSFTFDEPGTFDYFCEIHPEMTATIVVNEAPDQGLTDNGSDAEDLNGNGANDNDNANNQ